MKPSLHNYQIKKIDYDFHKTATQFLTDIYNLENKEVPNFFDLDCSEITKLYGNKVRELNLKLMWHKNDPVDAEFLCKLYEVKSLPRSTKIILKSILK